MTGACVSSAAITTPINVYLAIPKFCLNPATFDIKKMIILSVVRTKDRIFMIGNNLEEKVPEERIPEKLQRRFKLEKDAAKAYFDKYALVEQ